MKARKILVLTSLMLAVVLSVLGISSCGFGHIEDTNGDDTSLCTLTDEDIFAKSTSHTSFGTFSTQLNNKYTYKASKLSGVYKLDRFSARSASKLIIKASTTLSEGNLRIVLMCDGEYVKDIPIGIDQTVEVDAPSGKYEIRLAAESAKLQFEYSYEFTSSAE